MATLCSKLNRVYCSRNYLRVKADAEKHAARLAQKRETARRRRAAARPISSASLPREGLHASPRTQGKISASIADRVQVFRDANPDRLGETLQPDATGSQRPASPSKADLESATLPDSLREQYEERAAIKEFDGGLTQGDAEAAAMKDLLNSLFTYPDSP
jgi:hypothetical protein